MLSLPVVVSTLVVDWLYYLASLKIWESQISENLVNLDQVFECFSAFYDE